MAHTCNQAFDTNIKALKIDIGQNNIDIQNINSNITTTLNSTIDDLSTNMKEVKHSIHILSTDMQNFMSQLWGPTSSEQPSYQDDDDSSHSMVFHSNHLHHELFLLKVEVEKIDGSDPMS
jgi:hypothetical protein